MQDADKPHKRHHAAQAGPKARKREEAVKKKKGTLEQSKKDHKNTRVGVGVGLPPTGLLQQELMIAFPLQ